METEKEAPPKTGLPMQAASKAVADIKTTLVRPVTYQSYAGRLFYLWCLSI